MTPAGKPYRESDFHLHFLLLLLLCFTWSISPAQNSQVLDIESLTNGTFRSKGTALGYWLSEESGYVQIENERQELVKYDPGTGRKTVLLSIEDIPEISASSRISDYQFSPDESKVILTLGSGRNREYYITDRKRGSFKKIDLDTYAPDIQSLKLSPDNNYVSFVHGANIYIYDLNSGDVTQLTTDGSDKIINSTASFRFASVQNSREYQWSPDSRYLAFNQFNTEGVRSFTIIDYIDSLYPTFNTFQYVKPGETLPSVRTGIIEISGEKTTWMKIDGDPRNNYITNLTWRPNSDELYIQQLNRNQNIMNVFLADAGSGATRKIFTESEDTFLEPFNLVWIDKGEHFIWMSENDGWRHIYRVTADGKEKQLITPGDYDVSDFDRVDKSSKWVYFEASPESTVHRYGYRVKSDGSGKTERLTPENNIGTNHYLVSPDGKWAFRSYSRFDKPVETTLVSLPDHKTVKVLEDNAELVAKIKEINPSPVEYFKTEIEDGVSLDSWMIKPPDFDEHKKYPIIFHVYSMPASQSTIDQWKGNSYFFYQLLTKKGFIVMGIDGRGTPSLAGREWRKSIYLKHGILPADDIAKATEIMLKKRPYMDPGRIGVYGWSGGGLMSLMLILRHPDIFKTAIPGAYISNHRYYHAGFTERYMGTPQDNPEAYEETAVLNYAKNLKGDLLLLHGTGDDNVQYQNTEALVNKLIEEKKRFFVIPYPNRMHNMQQGKNTQYHLYDTYLWFFSKCLMPDN